MRARQNPAESPADSYRNCPRTTTRYHQFFFKRTFCCIGKRQNDHSRNEFSQSNSAVIAALESYQGWLQKDVFRFMATSDLAADYLLERCSCTTEWWTLRPLLQIGYADLHHTRRSSSAIAGEVEPTGHRARCLAEWSTTILRLTICW